MAEISYGNKADRLSQLQTAGLPVPSFIAFRADKIPTLDEIQSKISVKKYAVRSSADIEDQNSSSMAGQFRTILNLETEELLPAIDEVIQDALYKKIKKADFSVIIQEFIEPDESGIIFTRCPSAGIESILSVFEGRGEKIVSGEKNGKTIKFHQKIIPKNKYTNLLFMSKKIERLFNFPQDIEWALKDNKFYILQARNITTISKKHNTSLQKIDKKISSDFLLEKSLSESVAKIDKNTLNLLKKIYSDFGPIAKTYNKFKIKYQYTDFLQIIDGQLFVDKELELHSLLPAFSYFVTKDGKIKPSRIKGLLSSFLNQSRLNTAQFNFNELKTRLFSHLVSPAENLEQFLIQYQTIFEINLACTQAIRKFPDSEPQAKPSFKKPQFKLPKIGNSLSYSDKSPFKHQIINSKNPANPLSDWLHLREYARILTVININNTRPVKIENFQMQSDTPLPYRMTNLNIPESGPTVISKGEIKGTVKRAEQITKNDKNIILYTEALSPDLTKFFPHLSGIISKNGNLLSHLGIMAREHNIPTISGLDYKNIKEHFPHLKIED